MLWYEGSIAEAIQLSKSRKCIFLVYIFADDELSQKMDDTWNDESVSAVCQNCVAVKIQSPSDMCQHFSQIYPVVVVPSTFFIGLNGVPIEVIAGNLPPEDFQKKVEEVLKKHENQTLNSQPMVGASGAACPANPAVSQADPTPPSSPQGSEQKEPERIQDDGPKAEAVAEPPIASTSEMDVQSAPSTSSADDETPAAAAASSEGTESSENKTGLDFETKVERAKEKMDQSRVQRAQKEDEDEKSKEIDRRRLGKDLQKFRRHQEEKSFKDIQEEIKKQKEEDRKARQRIKDEIERDKLERKAKYEREKAERDRLAQEARERKQREQEMSAAEREAARREISRLQFRLPNGSSVTHQFKSSEPLSAACNYITQHLGCSDVQLYTVFPKRTFTFQDMSSTLLSLELVPSAVLLVLPQKNAIARTADTSTSILNIIFAPFFMLWNFFYGLIFGRPSGSAENNGESKKRPREEVDGPGPSSSNRPSTAFKRRSPISRQEGNIHKFTNTQDDDDEKSTWNGNSTQQM